MPRGSDERANRGNADSACEMSEIRRTASPAEMTSRQIVSYSRQASDLILSGSLAARYDGRILYEKSASCRTNQSKLAFLFFQGAAAAVQQPAAGRGMSQISTVRSTKLTSASDGCAGRNLTFFFFEKSRLRGGGWGNGDAIHWLKCMDKAIVKALDKDIDKVFTSNQSFYRAFDKAFSCMFNRFDFNSYHINIHSV